jgi:signal transduction histidine kinase
MLTEMAQEDGQIGFVPDLQRIRSAGRQLLALLSNTVPILPEGISKDRRGSTDFLVNRSLSEPLPGPAAEQSVLPSQGLLLVADDSEANRDVLSRRLQRQGYEVVAVASGREALEEVRAHAFDLMLLDILMPEMDGYQVLQQMKEDEALCHIPVIMISALHELDSVVRCIEMGAEDYLPQPFNPILLKARIGACLEKKRARDREVLLFNQLQGSYKRLQELEKLRDDLTHMIIHDLRTPLSSVMVGMQALEIVGDLNQPQREIMGIALDGGETLLAMISHLLDVEKMESSSMRLNYEMLSVADLVTAAIDQVAPLVKEKQLALEKQIAVGLPPFRGDENKLLRTLVNLLGNAIKFTSSGGSVTVAARASDDEQALLFSVRDTGEGIPPAEFERIFEKFGQVESRRGGRMMSTGLGLTFCRLAVQAHGGHIAVESIPGDG